MEKSRSDSAARSKENYDKDPESGIKSTARSKACYDEDPESCIKSMARSKACYDKDPGSGIKSTDRSKACNNKDVDKSRADSAARSKANYEKNIEASHTSKRQRYVTVCVCSLIICILSKVLFQGRRKLLKSGGKSYR